MTLRETIAQAIRDYPTHANRPGFQYGLDDLDFEDFVPDLTNFIEDAIYDAGA